MPVQTKSVAGRRELHFSSLEEVQAEIERLATADVKCLGNWSLGQIFQHLATAMNASLDGTDAKLPFFVRWIAPLFKNKILNSPMSPGFKAPKQMTPQPEVSVEEGLAAVRASLQRTMHEEKRVKHVVLGNLTREEHDKMHLRHAEMHLSFVVPVE